MRIKDSFTSNYGYKPLVKQPIEPPTPVTPVKPKPQGNTPNKLSDLQLLQAATQPMNGNVSYAYQPANVIAANSQPYNGNASFFTPWQPLPTTKPAPGYNKPVNTGVKNNVTNDKFTSAYVNAFPSFLVSGQGLTTVNGQQSIVNNPNAVGDSSRYVPSYIGSGGPGPGDPGYAASVVTYGSPVNNPGFGISIAGGGNPSNPNNGGGNPNDPSNPNNGLDPNYSTSGRGGAVDFKDADWNPALPYRSGGYDIMEVLNNNADMYRTGFNYANNFDGAYLGQIEGYDTAGNPLPQIAGYYVYNGKYYPIDLRSYNKQHNTPTWQQYTGRSVGKGSNGGGGSGGGGSSNPISAGNDDFFQQALNWKI